MDAEQAGVAVPAGRAGWTSPADVRREVQRLWDRGVILAEVAGGETVFPRRLALRRPQTEELLHRYADARHWVQTISSLPHVRVVWAERAHRQLGRNELPAQLWLDTAAAACQLIGTQRAFAQFERLVTQAAESVPDLVAWMARRPLDCLANADVWAQLLAVVAWMVRHPRPGIFVRQVDLPGVDTKFIETHRALLSAMLDVALPQDAVDRTFPPSSFDRRYGFRVPPAMVTVRVLDPHGRLLLDSGSALDAADRPVRLTVEDFARVAGVETVFVTENYVNFLAFPSVAGAIVVFGQGNDVGKLADAAWLEGVPVFYWGDIDTHGFAILDLLRSKLGQVRSMLMDPETLLRHQAQWVVEDHPVRRDLPHLTEAEQQVYDDLRDNRLGHHVRLEQELIAYGWLLRAVAALTTT